MQIKKKWTVIIIIYVNKGISQTQSRFIFKIKRLMILFNAVYKKNERQTCSSKPFTWTKVMI